MVETTRTCSIEEEFLQIFGFRPERYGWLTDGETAKIERILEIFAHAIRSIETNTVIKRMENRSFVAISGNFTLAISIAKMSGYKEKGILPRDYLSSEILEAENGYFLPEFYRVLKACNKILERYKYHC